MALSFGEIAYNLFFVLTVHLIACIFLQDPLSTGRILFGVIARAFKKVTS